MNEDYITPTLTTTREQRLRDLAARYVADGEAPPGDIGPPSPRAQVGRGRANPVVSDRGDWFADAELAAKAFKRHWNNVRCAIRGGWRCAGRTWFYEREAPPAVLAKVRATVNA